MKLLNGTEVIAEAEIITYDDARKGWVAGDTVYSDAAKSYTLAVGSVSPVEFKLLFTSQERIAIKNHVDPIIQDFFGIVEDPRLSTVDLNLQSTQGAVEYTMMVLETDGVITDGTARAAEILTGIVQ